MLQGLVFTNGFSIVLVWLVGKWPNVGRAVTGLLFLAASIVNFALITHSPGSYVSGFGPFAILEYREFIYGFFAADPGLFVVPVAAGQALIGILVLASGWKVKLGLLGAAIFFSRHYTVGFCRGFSRPVVAIGGHGNVVAAKI